MEQPVSGTIDLAALYDRYFTVVPADTPALLDAAHALRYQVYCVEHHFEDPAGQEGQRERDQYDAHSKHAVLIYKPSSEVVGCVRLILPTPQGRTAALPIRSLLDEPNGARFDQFPQATTAEISRYAVSKMFRRREGEDIYPDANYPDVSPNELRRLVPHVSLGLIRAVAHLSGEYSVTHLCAAMAPALLRLLERFGLAFELLGPRVDYHGERQACIADCADLQRGLAAHNREYHRLINTRAATP